MFAMVSSVHFKEFIVNFNVYRITLKWLVASVLICSSAYFSAGVDLLSNVWSSKSAIYLGLYNVRWW